MNTNRFGRGECIVWAMLIYVAAAGVAAAETADGVLAKHALAVGGAERQRSNNSTKTDSLVVMDENGPGVRTTMYVKRPNKIRLEYEFPKALVIMAYNGEIGWSQAVLPNGQKKAPSLLSKEKTTDFLEDFDGVFDEGGILNWQRKGLDIKLTGNAAVMGHLAYELELTRKSGAKEVIFIDTKNFLELERIRYGSRDGARHEIFFSDFKTWGGLTAPSITRVTCNGKSKLCTTIVSVDVSYPVDDTFFDLPKMSVN